MVAPPHASGAAGRLGQPLFAAYSLRTGRPDRAAITFADKTVLDINRNTSLVLRSARLTAVSRGEISVTDTPGSHHVVTTADASATAVGTLFDVRIETGRPPASYGAPSFPAGTTTVSVVQGQVRVANGRGAVNVHSGQWTHVVPGRPPTTPTAHNARSDVAWSSVLKP
jgi:ferric-dicitrate binding protein FerR (iron transport regulator)